LKEKEGSMNETSTVQSKSEKDKIKDKVNDKSLKRSRKEVKLKSVSRDHSCSYDSGKDSIDKEALLRNLKRKLNLMILKLMINLRNLMFKT